MWQPGMSMEDVEKEVYSKALRFYQNNKSQTSRSLGVSVRTLDSKIEKYDIEKKGISATEEKIEPPEPKKIKAKAKSEYKILDGFVRDL